MCIDLSFAPIFGRLMVVMPEKKPKSAKDIYQDCVNTSVCVVDFDPSIINSPIRIIFYGALAKIPSLKNSKLPGYNFHSPSTTAKLRAMTDMYDTAVYERQRVIKGYHRGFHDDEIYLQVILGKGARTDEDNAYAAVRDWLEPKHKNNRAWGIGISDNDKFVTGEARHAERLGLNISYTIITIRPYIEVKQLVTDHTLTIGKLDHGKIEGFAKYELAQTRSKVPNK
jgi:hypothetical protein